MREIEKAKVHKTVEKRVEVSEPPTEWADPVVYAPKKPSTLPVCASYRRLNAITVRVTYSISRTDECIYSPGDAQIFSTLDENSGYWPIQN